jgi:hypothetical protein
MANLRGLDRTARSGRRAVRAASRASGDSIFSPSGFLKEVRNFHRDNQMESLE